MLESVFSPLQENFGLKVEMVRLRRVVHHAAGPLRLSMAGAPFASWRETPFYRTTALAKVTNEPLSSMTA